MKNGPPWERAVEDYRQSPVDADECRCALHSSEGRDPPDEACLYAPPEADEEQSRIVGGTFAVEEPELRIHSRALFRVDDLTGSTAHLVEEARRLTRLLHREVDPRQCELEKGQGVVTFPVLKLEGRNERDALFAQSLRSLTEADPLLRVDTLFVPTDPLKVRREAVRLVSQILVGVGARPLLEEKLRTAHESPAKFDQFVDVTPVSAEAVEAPRKVDQLAARVVIVFGAGFSNRCWVTRPDPFVVGICHPCSFLVNSLAGATVQ